MPIMPPPFIIAIDGPAASGKGTLARGLSARFHMPYLETGRLYRAVGWRAIATACKTDDIDALTAIAHSLTLDDMHHDALFSESVGQIASVISALPEIRNALLEYQREFANQPGGAVLDGRDIGTIVCPNAAVKIYIDAAIEIRAKRRFTELQSRGVKAVYEHVLLDLKTRDQRDKARAIAPLQAAQDALILDVTYLNAEQVLTEASQYLESIKNALPLKTSCLSSS
jgi:cytidylate kinase